MRASQAQMAFKISQEQSISCCASPQWAHRLAAASPFRDFAEVVDSARCIWWAEVGASEWLSAFAAHPRIGDNKAVEEKPAAFAAFSRSEQTEANESYSEDVAEELLKWNRYKPCAHAPMHPCDPACALPIRRAPDAPGNCAIYSAQFVSNKSPDFASPQLN